MIKVSSNLPTKYGLFQILIYHSNKDKLEHVVLIKGDLSQGVSLLRVHSQCLTGDIFSSLRCDCGTQLDQSLKKISRSKSGILIYLNQEGRGIGLTNKIRAYALQEKGLDTVEANEELGFPADVRKYKIVTDILKDLGISKVKLLTNNPDKIRQLSRFGITIVKTIPIEVKPNKINRSYLLVKKKKLSHRLRFV